MNEVLKNTKMRKHRKKVYEESVQKLILLESQLLPLRKAMDENCRLRARKKQLYIDEINKDSRVSEVNLNQMMDDKHVIKKRIKMNGHDHMVPPSPVSYRDQAKSQLASQLKFQPISPAISSRKAMAVNSKPHHDHNHGNDCNQKPERRL